MATAYAAFSSLMHLIRQLNEHPRPPIKLDEKQVDSLNSIIRYFGGFLKEDRHSTIDRELEIRMADAAHAAENVIETHIADQIRSRNLYIILGDLKEQWTALTIQNHEENQEASPRSSSDELIGIRHLIMDLFDNLSQLDEPGHKIIPISDRLHLPYAMDIIEQVRNAQTHPDHQVDGTVDTDLLCSMIRGLELLAALKCPEDVLVDALSVVANHANDFMETSTAERVRDRESFYGSLERAIQGLDSLKEQVMEMHRSEQSQRRRPPSVPPAPSQPPVGEDVMVGSEDIAMRIVDKLTLHKPDRNVISIVGMGGIGKTTLARHVYHNPYIASYFHLRAWATISMSYNIHEILVEILRCLDTAESKESLSRKSDDELSVKLHKSLFGRRYLVILDDVWDAEAWEGLRSFFPTGSGGGVVMTTRESKVASFSSHSFRMDLLDKCESWELLCKKVFGQDDCPAELEDVGKSIAKNCGGLPLSIVVIGGHLAKSPRTREYWKYIAENLSSIVNSEDDDRCLKILSLSYTHLPMHLKPCFLYMAIFPEDDEIHVRKLIRLWVAEGFVEPTDGKSLEEAAEDFLHDLIDRNLIVASRSSLRGKIKICKIHDLLRDLCLKEALEKNFFFLVKGFSDYELLVDRRRIVLHPDEDPPIESYVMKRYISVNDHQESNANLRTLIFDWIVPSLEYKLLRVCAQVHGLMGVCHVVSEEAHWPVNMRYIEYSPDFDKLDIPSSAFLHWNLQYLFLNVRLDKELEIWKMTQLRDVKIKKFTISYPISESNDIMKNLRSAQTIFNFDFSKEAVKRIPNVKKLGVCYKEGLGGFDQRACILSNIGRLQKLESFRCFLDLKNVKPFRMLRSLTFPHSLRRLSFSHLCWHDVTTKIGSLPLLEVLKLRNCLGRKWKIEEGKFTKLISLELYKCRSLQYFTADEDHFPRLQSLVLKQLHRLKGISSDLGDMVTLKSIQVEFCPDSAVVCAKKIADNQRELANEELQVKAVVLKKSSLSEISSTRNFHFKIYDSGYYDDSDDDEEEEEDD